MDENKKKYLKILLYFVTLSVIGIGAYTIWDYERVKKINATVVSPAQALQIIQANS